MKEILTRILVMVVFIGFMITFALLLPFLIIFEIYFIIKHGNNHIFNFSNISLRYIICKLFKI